MYRPSVPIFALNIVLFAFELYYSTTDASFECLTCIQALELLPAVLRGQTSRVMHETVHTQNVISAVYLQHD